MMKEVRDAVVEIVEYVTVADLCGRWRTPEPGWATDFMI